jgi:hypothetical protein
MRALMTRLFTYAKSNAIALLALFVALGGTSYAAIALPAGSVGTRQLRNRAVTEKKLGARAVGAANLNSKSIAGYVAFWAHVGANGQVIGSNPRASVIRPYPGADQVTWPRPISTGCFVLASVTDSGLRAGYANALFEGGIKQYKGVIVQTFDASGAPVFEPVNVAVICP